MVACSTNMIYIVCFTAVATSGQHAEKTRGEWRGRLLYSACFENRLSLHRNFFCIAGRQYRVSVHHCILVGAPDHLRTAYSLAHYNSASLTGNTSGCLCVNKSPSTLYVSKPQIFDICKSIPGLSTFQTKSPCNVFRLTLQLLGIAKHKRVAMQCLLFNTQVLM